MNTSTDNPRSSFDGYKHIFIPVDNSEHSNRAVEMGLFLAKAYGARITGSHIYAAKMHDVRFKQMEFTLPAEYQEEGELHKQRKIHDSLITMGLQLISDSYLDVLEKRCCEEKIPFERKMMDGKNWECLVKDIEASDYDLVIIGALGTGAVKHSGLGSVCERVVRRSRKDIMVIKDTRPLAEKTGPIVAGIDGSPQSFAGLLSAFSLAKTRGSETQAVAVYDPYLHYTVFNGIVDVLSEKASKIFRFKDQEQLHEDIIDTGLAKIYQSHLDVASRIAAERSQPLKTTLKDGKAFEKVYNHVEQTKPCLLVAGRVGVHNGDLDIGSNSENLLRLASCDVLLVSRKYVPPIDVKAEASMLWTQEATERFTRVPEAVRGIARTAVHRYAMERGHSIISNDIIDQVMAIFMPKTAAKLQEVALAVAKDKVNTMAAEGTDAYVCSTCGKIARSIKPVVCTVCGAPGTAFGLIGKKDVEALSQAEGGLIEDDTFDGTVVQWTVAARQRITAIKDGYIRRRTRAQVEKMARVRKLAAIDQELVDEVYGRDVKTSGGVLVTPPVGVGHELPSPLPMPVKWTKEPTSTVAAAPPNSEFQWTDDAVTRLNRVPQGFMRDNTRYKIEELAREKGVTLITLEHSEAGIEKAKEIMAQMISAYNTDKTVKA